MDAPGAIRLIDEGNRIEDEGRLEEALERYDRAIDLAPELARGHLNRGNVLLAQGDGDGAIAAYATAVAKESDNAGAHFNLGNAYARTGRGELALAAYGRALALRPDLADAAVAKGNVLADLDRFEEAVASYRTAVRIAPEFAHAHYNLGMALQRLERLDEAIASYRRASAIDPSLAEAHYRLGLVLQSAGHLDTAIQAMRRATGLRPGYIEAHYNASIPLRMLGRLDEAEASLRRVLELDPAHVEAHTGLAMVLEDLMRLEEAEASYRQALCLQPDFLPAHNGLLFCMSHDESVDAPTLLAAHLDFGRQFEALQNRSDRYGNERDPGRTIRVGFVSGDLRSHAVASFVEPIFKELARLPGIALYAYHNRAGEDAVTARIRALTRHWRSVAGLSDNALAATIADDGIDILVDLSSHTAANRLLTFAHKPAPIQVSWIGYPGTSGLRAIDYYFADPHFLPPGQFDAQFVERIVYLPAVAPFLADAAAPPVNALPALERGFVTFGSFNRSSKLSRSVVAMWSQLLRAVPHSRMLVGGMPQRADPTTLVAWFTAEGIAAARLQFHERCDVGEYLRLHRQVDVCLDSYPYTGGTTTINALWMGVPTLTRAGATPASRQGAALLGQVGLGGFVALDADDFTAKGVRCARDLEGLAAIRAGLRGRIGRSPVGHPQVVANAIERAFRAMWQRWCAGLAPETLDVVGWGDAGGRDRSGGPAGG